MVSHIVTNKENCSQWLIIHVFCVSFLKLTLMLSRRASPVNSSSQTQVSTGECEFSGSTVHIPDILLDAVEQLKASHHSPEAIFIV